MFSLQLAVGSVQCLVFSVQRSVSCVLHSMFSLSVQCAVFNVQNQVCIVKCEECRVQCAAVCNIHADIQICSNIYGQIYSFALLCIEFFQCEYIHTFIH